MAENSKIEWTDHTFNPWIGCTKVSPGCDHCYAEARMDARLHRVTWGAGQPRQRTKTWGDPIRWNKAHEAFYVAHGRRQRVFCASLADVFDNQVPAEWRADLFELVASTPNLDWLLLTKRIGNVLQMVADAVETVRARSVLGEEYMRRTHHTIPPRIDGLPANVWLGATIVNQAEADRDIPKLLATPAAMRFLSMEPLLGPVNLTAIPGDIGVGLHSFDALRGRNVHHDDGDQWTPHPRIDWVIVGGESGSKARPMHPDWARSLRDQCAAAGVPFLFKQWGRFRRSAKAIRLGTFTQQSQTTACGIGTPRA